MIGKVNKLTEAQIERLAMLSEECGEVVQVVGKILRHGYDSYHPNDPNKVTNLDLLQKELTDILAVVSMIEKEDRLKLSSEYQIKRVAKSKLRWTHHQEN